MTRFSSLVSAIADAALTVAISLVVPLIITIASWLITGGFQTTLVDVPFTIAAAVWALGLGGGVGVAISPGTYPALGIAEPFVFVVSIAPLVFTAFIAWMAWRVGDRLSNEDAPWAGLAGSVVSFGLASWLSIAFATADPFRIDVQGAVTVGTLVWAVALLVGVRIWDYLPWSSWIGDRLDEVAHIALRSVRIAAGLVVGTIGLATLFLIIALVTSMGRVIGLTEALQLDVAGVIGVGLLQLAYLPTLIIWAVGWVLGPGIQLGEGSIATLGGTDAGPLPIVPLLGMLPEGSSPYLWSVVALPVLLAAVIALIARSRDEGIDDRVWWERLLVPIIGALVAAGALALLAQLSRGAIGPERLTEFGPQPGWVFLVAFGVFVIGGAIGAYLPLEPSTATVGIGSDAADADALDSRSASEEFDADETDPKTRPHLIPIRNILGKVLGERFFEHDDHDEDRETPQQADDEDAAIGDASNRGNENRGNESTPDLDDEQPSDDAGHHDPHSKTRGSRTQASSPYARPRPRQDLRDAVRRPDEPDIYADIDLHDDPK